VVIDSESLARPLACRDKRIGRQPTMKWKHITYVHFLIAS
jgi:hypothetical protein